MTTHPGIFDSAIPSLTALSIPAWTAVGRAFDSVELAESVGTEGATIMLGGIGISTGAPGAMRANVAGVAPEEHDAPASPIPSAAPKSATGAQRAEVMRAEV
jgi:hypothetical protein